MNLADYLDILASYLPEEKQQAAHKLASELEDAASVTEDTYARILEVGHDSWPMRRAVQRFVEAEGAEKEWKEILSFARPGTRFLLMRLRHRSGAATLKDALVSEHAVYAIHENEEAELAFLRPEVHARLWQKHQEQLTPYQEEAVCEAATIRERLAQQRAAKTLPDDAEYRIFVEGETII